MVMDIGSSTLQFFLDFMYLVILYISKVGLIVGLLFTTERLCKTIIDKSLRFHLNKIFKGLGLVTVSLIIYLIFV